MDPGLGHSLKSLLLLPFPNLPGGRRERAVAHWQDPCGAGSGGPGRRGRSPHAEAAAWRGLLLQRRRRALAGVALALLSRARLSRWGQAGAPTLCLPSSPARVARSEAVCWGELGHVAAGSGFPGVRVATLHAAVVEEKRPRLYTKTCSSWEWEDVSAAGLPRQSSITFHLCGEWVHSIQKQ